MKAAKAPRTVWRYRFEDGSIGEVDAIETLRKMASGFRKMAFVAGLDGREEPRHYYELRAHSYEQEAKRLEDLPQRARRVKLRELSREGGKATAKKFARPDLETLIRACLERGEKTRDYAKTWADDFNVSADTIERAIKRVKNGLAAK